MIVWAWILLLLSPMQSVYHAISVLMTLLGLILASQAKACPDLIGGSTDTASLIQPLGPKAFTMIQEFKDYEASKGIAPDDRTEFYLHETAGTPVQTRAVVIIYHGLLNSPSYTRWLAKRAFEMGANVINVNLAKHNHGRPQNLNTLTEKDMWNQVVRVNRLAEQLGQQLLQWGHSAGGLSAIFGAMESPHSKGLVVYAPALQVTDKTWWSSYLVGRTFITNSIINATSDDPRYLSAASGRATDRFANFLEDAPGVEGQYQQKYGLMIQLLSQMGQNIFWIDTQNDATILDSVNKEVADQIPGLNYYLVPEEFGVAHVNLADDPESLSPEGGALLNGFTEDILENLKTVLEP